MNRQPPSCEFRGETTRLWHAEWGWQRPAQAQVEPDSQALFEPEFVEAAVSDLPAEVDLEALLRWMTAMPAALV